MGLGATGRQGAYLYASDTRSLGGNSRLGWSSGSSSMMAGGRTRLIFGVGDLQATLLEMKGEGLGGFVGVGCR